jgi:hypothetical protein
MSTHDWNTLVEQLAVPYTAYREAELHVRRGGPSWRKPAGGHPPAFTLSEMLLITVLRARFRISQPVLAELFGVSTPTIAKANRQVKTLLDQRKHTITPTGIRMRTLTELTHYADTHGITLTPGVKAAR